MRWLPFSKSDAAGKRAEQTMEAYPLVAKQAWCSVCDKTQTFTKVWRRAVMMRRCPNCGMEFDEPSLLYQRTQPICLQCREPLEQPSFDYGFCDGCGSKFELMDGAKPGLLPNQAQRNEMDKHGKSWSW